MKIYLIPTPISEIEVASPQTVEAVRNLDYFFVENIRTARRWIASLKLGISIESLSFEILDKNTKDIKNLFDKVPEGKNVGILSEAGCPGIADPGALAVAYAHKKGYEVVPLVGASSITLALMSSGMSGQSFVFHGYLPIKAEDRKIKIAKLAKDASTLSQTQIFIETPYRNDVVLADLIKTLPKDIFLCVASGLLSEKPFLKTMRVSEWQKVKTVLGKVPTVFLIGLA